MSACLIKNPPPITLTERIDEHDNPANQMLNLESSHRPVKRALCSLGSFAETIAQATGPNPYEEPVQEALERSSRVHGYGFP